MTTVTDETKNPVVSRLEELCDGDWSFNRFPPGEIARISKETDPYRVFQLGTYAGAANSVYGQARISQMPYQVREALGLVNANSNSVWTVYYFLAIAGGQRQKGKPNIVAVFPNNYGSESYVTVVEIGCQHEYQGIEIARCAHDYTCQKCGFSFFVDSGD